MLEASADWHSLFSPKFPICIFTLLICVLPFFLLLIFSLWHFFLFVSTHTDTHTGSRRFSMFWPSHKQLLKIFPFVQLIQMKVEYPYQTHASITSWTIFNLTGELFVRTYQLTNFWALYKGFLAIRTYKEKEKEPTVEEWRASADIPTEWSMSC